MAVPKWAKFLGRDSYNSWVANKFKAAQTTAIDAIRDVDRSDEDEWSRKAWNAVKLASGLAGTGTGDAGLMGGLAKDTYGVGKAAWQGYQENVAKPGSGLIQATGVNPVGALAQGAPGLGWLSQGLEATTGTSLVNRPGFDPSNLRPGVVAGGPTAWKQEAETDRGFTGLESFGLDVAGDPLSYPGGGLAKGALRGAGAPGAARVAEKLFAAPGKAVGKVIDEGVKAFESIPVIGEESIRSQGTRFGDKATNMIAELSMRLGTEDVGEIRRVIEGVRNPKAASGLTGDQLQKGSLILAKYEDEASGITDSVLKGLGDINEPNVKGFSISQVGGTPRVPRFDEAMARGANEARSGFIKTEQGIRRAAREEKLATGNPAEKAAAWAAKTMDMVSSSRPAEVAGGIQRGISKAILGTPGYLLTNIPEDIGRGMRATGEVNKVRPQEARGILGQFEGDLPTNIPASILRDESQLARTMGEEIPNVRSGLGRVASTFTPSGIIEESNRLGGDFRRGAWLTEFRKNYDRLTQEGTGVTDAMRQAVDQANDMLVKNFPGYGPESNLARAAKTVLPFAGYETHRLQYLPRAMAETPAIPATIGHLRENTDKGEIPLLGTDYTIDPMKGGVYSILSKLDPNEFSPLEAQTYTTGLSGKIERGMQFMGEAGFYPNTAVNLGAAAIRGVEDEDTELGRLVPSTVRAGLGLTGALPGPVGSVARNIQDAFGDDRFRQYFISQELARQGIEPDKATPQQREKAAAISGVRNAITTLGGVFKFSPEDVKEAKDRRIQEAIAAGVPEDIARRPGNPLTAADEQGQQFINAGDRKAIYERDAEKFRGKYNFANMSQVGQPLQRKDVRKVNESSQKYYDALDEMKVKKEEELKPWYERYADGRINYQTFKEARATINEKYTGRRDQLAQDFPDAIKTPEEKESFYKETGREFSTTPEDLAVQEYNEIEPEVDEITGELDFRGFFQAREEYLANQPQSIRDYILRNKDKPYSDPRMNEIEKEFRRQQSLIREYLEIPKYTGIDDDEADMVDEALAQYNALRGMHPDASKWDIWDEIAKQNPRGAELAQEVKWLRNEDRRVFMESNPELRQLFSSATGLRGVTIPT